MAETRIDDQPRTSTRWPVAGLVVIAIVAVVAYVATRPPTVTPREASVDHFSAERAWPYLETLVGDDLPHPLGSAQNAIVRERLESLLVELGYEPTVQSTEIPLIRPTKNGFERGVFELHNVMTRRAGTRTGKAVLIASHYDSVPQAPGASDDGVAVAVMLEIAARLRNIDPLRNDVIFLFTDGEEAGLRGARVFAESHPWLADVGVVINLEARGTSGPSLMFQTGPHSSWLAGALSGARRPLTGSLFDEAYERLPNDTDFTIFMEHGLTGCNFAFIGDVQNYHTPRDDLAHASPRSMQHHGDNAWHLVQHFGNADLDALPAGEAVYFDLLGLTVIRWPEPATWFLAAGAVGLLITTWRRWRRAGHVRSARAIVALVVLPATLAVAYGVGTGATFLIELGGGWPHDGMALPILAAAVIWPVALVATALCATFTAWWARPDEIALGLWTCVAAATMAAAWVAVGTTYVLLVPLLLSLGCACWCRSCRPWIGLATLIGVGIIWLPLEYHFLDAFGWQATGFLTVRASIVLIPMLPLLAGISRRGKIAFGLSGLAVTLAAGAASCLWQGAAA